jgi:hypothetical protein
LYFYINVFHLTSQTILLEFNNEGKPRYNKIVVLGRKLIDAKSQTPEEEQEITVITTKFTKRITEVERTVELHRIRLENPCSESLLVILTMARKTFLSISIITFSKLSFSSHFVFFQDVGDDRGLLSRKTE